RTSRSRWALQGVMSLWRLATPMIGREKSSSRKPTARSMARLGARPGPPVVSKLRRSEGMGDYSWWVGGWRTLYHRRHRASARPGALDEVFEGLEGSGTGRPRFLVRRFALQQTIGQVDHGSSIGQLLGRPQAPEQHLVGVAVPGLLCLQEQVTRPRKV